MYRCGSEWDLGGGEIGYHEDKEHNSHLFALFFWLLQQAVNGLSLHWM